MKIKQIPDTQISITKREAFASVEIEIDAWQHGTVTIELDMESTIRLSEFLDNGAMIRNILRGEQRQPKKSWWRLFG